MTKRKIKRVLLQQSEFGDDYKVVVQVRSNKSWKCEGHAQVSPLYIAEETAKHLAKKHNCKIEKK